MGLFPFLIVTGPFYHTWVRKSSVYSIFLHLFAFFWWGEMESNHHSLRRLIYSQLGSPRAQPPQFSIGLTTELVSRCQAIPYATECEKTILLDSLIFLNLIQA